MRIPESHSDILEKKARSILSTISPNNEISSGFCFIRYKDDQILLHSIEEEQVRHIITNQKISIMVIDPSNVDRWLCIQGLALVSENLKVLRCIVLIENVILFPKES
jgi:hypothetical protein